MFSIGLSTNGKRLNEELFKQYRAAKIEKMELSINEGYQEIIDYKLLKCYADKYGVELWSHHLPFTAYDISSLDEEKRRLSVDTDVRLIKKVSADAGVKVFVVHCGGNPVSVDPDERKIRMDNAKKSLAVLNAAAKGSGAVIAVEDLPRSTGINSDEIKELLSVDESIRVCFDTNHLRSELPQDFIRKIGSKIITTHISDYEMFEEKHWLPGEGLVDWQEVIAAFKEVGYSGPWLYEVSFAKPATIKRQRELNCADFVRNAEELFGNKPITVLSEKIL